MTAVAEDKDAYRASFERFAAAHAASDPAWLRERRTAAIARFVEKGLPDRPRRGLAPHAGRPRSPKGRFEPADPAARPPADVARRAAARGPPRGAPRLRERAALARALVARPPGSPASRWRACARCCARSPGASSRGSAASRTAGPASSPTSTPPSPRTARWCSWPPARS